MRSSRRPHLDLVGVWVHSAEKTGRDAGEIVGLGPIGVTTTNDLDDIIALKPDCVVYGAASAEMDAAAVRDYVRLLNGGLNVVTTNTPGMMFPDRWIPEFADQVRAAALAGRGHHLHLGYRARLRRRPVRGPADDAVEHHPLDSRAGDLRLLGISQQGPHGDRDGIRRAAGLHAAARTRRRAAFAWGPPIGLVARALGVELDDVTEKYERVLTPRDLHVACGLIPAGTCGAVRAETTGVVNGKPVITIEHINRMAPDLAPEWASAPNGTYRLVIEGQPHIQCDLRLGTEDTPASANDNAMEATAMRVVNAIPYVVDAAPGIATSLDLPITAPHNAVVTDSVH